MLMIYAILAVRWLKDSCEVTAQFDSCQTTKQRYTINQLNLNIQSNLQLPNIKCYALVLKDIHFATFDGRYFVSKLELSVLTHISVHIPSLHLQLPFLPKSLHWKTVYAIQEAFYTCQQSFMHSPHLIEPTIPQSYFPKVLFIQTLNRTVWRRNHLRKQISVIPTTDQIFALTYFDRTRKAVD